jgi:hypothetical protein
MSPGTLASGGGGGGSGARSGGIVGIAQMIGLGLVGDGDSRLPSAAQPCMLGVWPRAAVAAAVAFLLPVRRWWGFGGEQWWTGMPLGV